MRVNFRSSRSFGRACKAHACRCWVKCIVITLSFLSTGGNRICPPAARIGMSLSVGQSRVVDELTRLVREFVRDPQSLGGRGLHKIQSLHDLGCKIKVSSVGDTVVGGRVDFVPLVASRTPFAKTVANFDASPFLPPFEAACLLEPRLLETECGASSASSVADSRGGLARSSQVEGKQPLRRRIKLSSVTSFGRDVNYEFPTYDGDDDDDDADDGGRDVHEFSDFGRHVDPSFLSKPPFKKGGMLAEAKELIGLAKQWDAHGKLILFDADEIDFDDTSNLLSVFKDANKDRLIMDRRARNSRERALEGAASLLPSGADFVGIQTPSQDWSCLRLYSHDLQDYYPSFLCSALRGATNVIARRFTAEDFSGTSALAARPDLVGRTVLAGLLSLPMGDRNAVDIAQRCHERILEDAGSFRPECRLGGGATCSSRSSRGGSVHRRSCFYFHGGERAS
jgi:hypothetical protein